MVKMANAKYVFVQALLLTIVVFVVGFYIGMSVESNRMIEINDYYIQSEVSLIDTLALDNLLEDNSVSCGLLIKANQDLLDRVYEEAILLEDFENSGKLTESLTTFHKKYDVLRTYLWINAIKIKERCGDDFSTVVYLYNNSQEDLTKKAEQNVWSRVLYEIKQEKKEGIFLIPIDVSTGLVSLNSLIDQYGIETFPVVIVNEDTVFRELVTKEEVLDLLN